MNNTKKLEEHFSFGKNWADYSSKISNTHIASAEKGLLKLIEHAELKNKTFLDIGSGSGIHALAALNLGAKSVKAIDIDPNSVETTRRVLEKYALTRQWSSSQESIFDFKSDAEQYDIVYSWGVLHHTGAMNEAIDIAAKAVKQNGLLVLALYAKTPLCNIWKIEKKFYSKAPALIQKMILYLFIFFSRLLLFLQGKDFKTYLSEYKKRGMDFYNDNHDWLGGYPYESVHLQTLNKVMSGKGFEVLRQFPYNAGIGLFGSGCFEVVYKKM